MFKKSTVLALHFAPSLRFTLSLQSAFCTQSAFMRSFAQEKKTQQAP